MVFDPNLVGDVVIGSGAPANDHRVIIQPDSTETK